MIEISNDLIWKQLSNMDKKLKIGDWNKIYQRHIFYGIMYILHTV
jgi:hypothetical protein